MSINYKTGDELVLAALNRDFKRLSRLAEKAKEEADECANVGSEFFAIHEEFQRIVEEKRHDKETLKRLEDLQKREAKARKIMGKNLVSLFDKQSQAEIDRDTLGAEIKKLEFRIKN